MQKSGHTQSAHWELPPTPHPTLNTRFIHAGIREICYLNPSRDGSWPGLSSPGPVGGTERPRPGGPNPRAALQPEVLGGRGSPAQPSRGRWELRGPCPRPASSRGIMRSRGAPRPAANRSDGQRHPPGRPGSAAPRPYRREQQGPQQRGPQQRGRPHRPPPAARGAASLRSRSRRGPAEPFTGSRRGPTSSSSSVGGRRGPGPPRARRAGAVLPAGRR